MTDALGGIRSALVLGGGSDIAHATLAALLPRGLRRAVLLGRHPEAMLAAAEPLRTAGVEVVTGPLDASEIEAHADLISEAFREFGDFDVVLLTFGVLGDQTRYEADPGLAGRDMVVNFAGAVSVGLAAANALRRQGCGTLVVMSSVAGQRPRRDNYVYGAAKAGLDAFARGLNEALHDSGARVMVVRPGFVRTKMTAGMTSRAAKMGQSPDVVARNIVAGLDRGAAVVWTPGMLRWMFLVLRALPQPLFRLLRA